VAAGQKITITGFGSFEKRHRAARTGNNPRVPGQKIQIAATDAPAFSAGAEFKRIVKGGYGELVGE
jgi:DNA-binding protein HU-beta